jgi:hypothetical protein
MTTEGVYRRDARGPRGGGWSPRDREPAGAEESTGRAGSSCGCGGHEPCPAGARVHRSATQPPETPAQPPEVPVIPMNGWRMTGPDVEEELCCV